MKRAILILWWTFFITVSAALWPLVLALALMLPKDFFRHNRP